MMPPVHERCRRMTEKQQNFKVNMYNFSVSIVSADGLGRLGARTSAGIVMAMQDRHLKG